MDHMMPEMDGVEAAKIIREMGVDVPIIALTANAVSGVKELLLAAGMNDFLSKPIIKASLNRMLKNWIPVEKQIAPPTEPLVVDEPDEAEAEAHGQQEFWNRIEQIGEISLQTGLDLVSGQRDVYAKSLKLMIKAIEKCTGNLNEFLEAGDMRNFSIEVHGMKGSLANIGADALSELARELEAAADQADASFCAANLPPFLERLNGFGLELKEAFNAKARHRGPIDIPPALPSIFEKMRSAFDEMNFAAIDEEMEKLDALNLNEALREEIEQLKDAVLVTDYDSAIEVMQKLLNRV
jgi:CheY-like chemotaxis protein